MKIKNITKISLLPALLLFFLFSLHNKEGLRAQEKNEAMDRLAEATHEQQEQIAPILSQFKGEDDGEYQVPMRMGLEIEDGTRREYVIQEYAIVKISGGKLTYLEFYYHRRQEVTLITEVRRIINDDIDDKNYTNLSLEYNTSMGMKTTYVFHKLTRDSARYKFLTQYRIKVQELIRLLEYHLERKIAGEGAGVDKILSIGEKEL